MKSFFGRLFPNIAKLTFSITSLITGIYINLVTSSIAGYRTPWIQVLDLNGETTGKYSLPDLGHEILPFIDFFELPNFVVEMQLYMFLALLTFHPKRFIILRRTTLMLGIIYLFRSITVLLTSLPDSSPICHAQFMDSVTGSYKKNRLYPTVFYRALKILKNGGGDITCGDMIFSGHTSLLFLLYFMFHKYCPNPIIHGLVNFNTFLGVIGILCTRLHYTIDVVIAIGITSSVFNEYHRLIHKLGWFDDDHEE